MRSSWIGAALLAVAASLGSGAASAQQPVTRDLTATNALSLPFGVAFSRIDPEIGGMVSLEYERRIAGTVWFAARPELVLNLRAPGGSVTKASAIGLDLGLEWESAPPGQFRLGFGAALGGRFFEEPGIGGVGRIGAGIWIPVAEDRFEIGPRVAVEGGAARVGDEAKRTLFQVRGDLLAVARLGF